MRNTLRLVLLCGLVLLTASTADAQYGRYGRSRGRGPRGGVVMGPDGPLYDTRSPEWQMSGGNIFMYQQLMEQKMEIAQQQYMYKQMQQAAKLQKGQANGKGKAKTKGAAAGQPSASNLNTPNAFGGDAFDPFAEPVNHYHRYKKKPTHKPAATSSTQSAAAKADASTKSP